jgi:hypothetical protein
MEAEAMGEFAWLNTHNKTAQAGLGATWLSPVSVADWLKKLDRRRTEIADELEELDRENQDLAARLKCASGEKPI